MNTDEAKPELTDDEWNIIEDSIFSDRLVLELRRLRRQPTLRDVAEWMKEQPFFYRSIAECLLKNAPKVAQDYAQSLIDFSGETAPWIACAAAGETEEALNQLIATIAKWREAKK